ncbi:MAG TPA: gliding motility-associated C-terminal domain-containing protein [Bacteroidia bacterium]|nr:gliding motility-associated C-terminal domain-containing protein [Bacteroidia bacterium]
MNAVRTSAKFYGLVFFCALFMTMAHAQDVPPFAAKVAPADPVVPGTSLPDRSTWVEDESQRTVFSSVYHTADGQYIAHQSSVPINYYDVNGKLQPIDFSPKKITEGWTAPAQPFPTFLFNDGSAYVSYGKDEGDYFRFGISPVINGVNASPQAIAFDGDTGTMHDVVPGVDRKYAFRLNGIETSYIVRQPQQVNSDNFVVTEGFLLDHGFTLKEDESRGRKENGGWTGDLLVIRESDDAVVGTIKAAMCYDAAGKYTFGTYVIRYDEHTDMELLDILVPRSWMNDAVRSYPVTIDPLVIGPTALWSGGSMPSCIAPANHTDSILVTIPGQITVTSLAVTSSFYADPFTTAIMSDGAMWFTTPCGSSPQFTIGPPNGNLPGTAYLDTFNLRSPLTCCYAQSCSPQTFYLTMHLSRTGPGTGCNTTYIRYDPVTTSWPFSAYIVGHTVEMNAQGFTVPVTPVCSNVCTFTGNVFIHYGVPPFTITHPWMTGSVTAGSPAGCNYAIVSKQITLTIPNCPTYCDTITTLTVPPPVVVDACGNIATGYPSRPLHIHEVPVLTVSPPSDTVCPGEPYQFNLNSCLAGSTVSWYNSSGSGNGNVNGSVNYTGTADTSITFNAFASINGCTSDTITFPAVVQPFPSAAFTFSSPAIAGVPVSFTDQSSFYSGAGASWGWDFGDNSVSALQNPVYTYSSPGSYTVCLSVGSAQGCADSVCQVIDVIPAEIIPPNVVTPNSDGVNDVLAFKFLEFYPDNHLQVFDRWGNLIFDKEHYANDWDPQKYTDGTYYYILTVNTTKNYSGFFELIKGK